MNYLPVSPDSLTQAAQILRNGGLVAFPTETVYGLGADAYNSAAIAKVFEVKERPRFDPLIIHISNVKTLEETADLSLLREDTRRKLFLLAENLWPGPLSLVLPKNKKIPEIATAGLETAAIRFPAHKAAQTLISLSGGAVAAPSANPFGSLSPTRAEHVRDKLGGKIDMILDGGQSQIGVESTVLDITGKSIKILRHGGTPKEEIEKLIGGVEDGFSKDQDFNGQNLSSGLASPGQLKSHYSPQKPLSVFSIEEIISLPFETDAAYLFFDGSARDAWLSARERNSALIRTLSEKGLVLEASARLFETLHELEKCQISRIFAQLAPFAGLGAAINDRLTRASIKS
ncbi:MAG: threonylcarbamoyl-AMP synthase [Treponema sp.]|jgi:L-threonylcarbamoyladenylate synthase|nr:threonylcarbamoyl-AMP synthase [Treponema sp.]